MGVMDGFGGGNLSKMGTRMISGYEKIVSEYNIIVHYVAAQTLPNEYRIFLKLFINCLIKILRELMVWVKFQIFFKQYFWNEVNFLQRYEFCVMKLVDLF